jgi:diaminohydroxyphosphoribosylaminopyrimidine deaminase/5-amino-6-(5-phosphoribosylamino)uracil reductase
VVDKVNFFIAPKIIGGQKSISVVGGDTFRNLPDSIQLRDMKTKKIGEDILLTAYVI